MEFDNNQHFVSRCPFCSAEYDLDGAKVIDEADDSTMVYVTCGECESSIVAIVAMSGLGIVSLGLVTDMSEQDTKRFLDRESISGDDMLELYEMLKNREEIVKNLTKS